MRRVTFLWLGALSCAGAACVGDIGDRQPGSSITGPDPTTQSCTDGGIHPGPAPIRRMTRFEYDSTVRDLLGDTTNPAADFGAEEESLGFNNNALNLITSAALAEKYMLAAEGISERATDPIGKVVPCEPTEGDACAKQFIGAFGSRAFRRPLTTAEEEMFFALYQVGFADGSDFRMGIRVVIEAALQSPAFLYRVELGVAGDGDVVHLNDWEMASRLSYFLWGTMPDEDLFTAAESGELKTPAQVEAQARRMLDDPRSREMVGNFHKQWLDYERIANVTKDVAAYPDWSPAFGQLMRQETESFIEYAVFDDAGDLETLLTAPYSFMNADLAAFYGLDVKAGPEFARVDLDPTQRAGLLTTGTLLSINSHTNQTSPVHRGKLVREQFLCDIMPPPPPNVMPTVPDIEPGSTTRERFAQHSKDPACKGCHQLMDPIGFGFENYDTVARYRTKDNGQPVDASGELSGSDVDGKFDGVAELAKKLATSTDVQGCYAKQWFRYGYGRSETADDQCSMDWLNTQFAESGGDIKELLVKLTQTDAFLYRPKGGTP
jgi:hypothetical protein